MDANLRNDGQKPAGAGWSLAKPIIVITGKPVWANDLAALFGKRDFELVRYRERGRYVVRLADDYAALVLVDGADPEWPFWTTTPKASPATRRIPVVVVSDDESVRAKSLDAGANLAIVPSDLNELSIGRLAEMARRQTAEERKLLEAGCDDELPSLARKGIEHFNAGRYYEQHDSFEELWMAEDGPLRDLYRAILQVGVAYYQITRGNHRGALKMLLRSVQWLARLPDECQGVDVRQLREDSSQARAALERLDEDDLNSFDLSLLKPVIWIEERELL